MVVADAEDLRRWVIERMEDALERCDAALDAAQRAAKQPRGDGAPQVRLGRNSREQPCCTMWSPGLSDQAQRTSQLGRCLNAV